MGRVRERCPDDATFLTAMKMALNYAINGHFDYVAAQRHHVEAARASLKMLEDHARSRPNAEELLRTLRTRLPTIDRIEELARHQFIVESPGVPIGAPEHSWHLYLGPGESAMAPGYRFTTEPLWDHDDVAEYCLLEKAEESHRRILLRWLAHQWAVGREPSARLALVKMFQPLVQAVRAEYGRAGAAALGKEYGPRANEYLAAALEQAIDEFDFFFKRYDPLLKLAYDEEATAYRRLAHVTSDLELPIGHYLKQKLIDSIRGFLDLQRRNPKRVRGPFRVRGRELMVLLIEDAAELLEISESQVRRRIGKRQLVAWQPRALRDHLGLPRDEDLVLDSAAGEIHTRGHNYWIIDAKSAVALKAQRNAEGKYELGRRGRPRKEARPPALPITASAAAPVARVPSPRLPQARLVRDGEPEPSWPPLRVTVVPDDEEERGK